MEALADGERTGRSIRETLTHTGFHMSGPALYQLMSRLVGEGLVVGWDKHKTVSGGFVKERWYRKI